MSAEQRRQQRFLALDPVRGVAVEACAGSGKTWLLSSRLVRLLLAGVKPGEILAITYTRKAAREIESRLRGVLAELATGSDEQVIGMLVERGLTEDAARAAMPRARGLFETVLHATPAITVTTFHGWFARLLSGAPLDSGLAGRNLDEAAAVLLDEAWVQLAGECARAPEEPLAQSLLWLYQEIGAHNTRKLLKAFVDRRAEWRVWADRLGSAGDVIDGPLAEWLAETFGGAEDPFAECVTPHCLGELDAFARLLGQNTTGDQSLGNALAQAVVDVRGGLAASECFSALRAAFLTKEGQPRARKSSGAQAKRLGEAGENSFLELHLRWSERLIAVIGRLQDQRNGLLNLHALRVGLQLLAKLDGLKRSRRVMDFSDLEAEIDALLARDGAGAWLQARLDARYRHILLDEFQDTNPLQWRILRAWLDAYEGMGAERPGVFLVGDPKQSIYRFRRAEPKLFSAAVAYFEARFGAVSIGNAHTFRNAEGIVALVNAVCGASGMAGFEAQTAERTDWPSRVEVLPLIAASADEGEAAAQEGMRDPLERPRVEAEDLRRAEEASLLAERIAGMAGRWLVRDKSGRERPARYADILILTRRKTQLGIYEAALRAAGIPFVSPGRGGLLDTLEARDLLAVLHFLADPANDLHLAHTLRTPAFSLSDEDLLAISASEGSWWPALQRLAASGEAPRLVRAVSLLRAWLGAAAHLPAHDLIDRIFHESDWFARTRAALPAALWPGVHANLQALLELALNVDAGRYPSLTRFVDELRRLSSSDDEAPDEGLVAAGAGGEGEGDHAGRVRIMTIHGAKGLEAPIVWLIDANATLRSGEGYGVALDWPAEDTAPRHFSLLGKVSEAGASRAEILAGEKAAAEREELNLLYVAMTRAQQVLLVSGIESARAASAVTPYRRIAAVLDEHPSLQALMPQWAEDAGRATVARTPPQRGDAPAVPRVGSWRTRASTPAPEEALGLSFGTALHAWLEAHCMGWPLPQADVDVVQAAQRILGRPALAALFDPSRYLRAGNETAYVSSDGRDGRIDRWVDDGETIWVLDYKSGSAAGAPMDEYRAQLGRYRDALHQVFPERRVKSLLVFTQGGEITLE
ncbi:UvrD-helicase domain-containing protein [Uliginosibacterium sp. H1]|uniref:UvrD-helicase domain-containing protein n=1 Tax=Uliginosibacterium sp. H1 TaxID=3114757 RepID=UPI002E180C77|nr:UvrD-helicase domain-containing protein [Uliginosibacterium sp. H1]